VIITARRLRMAVGTKDEKGGASEGVDRRAMAVLSLGHLCSDATQVAVPALLPFLVREQGISYAAAGTLVLASTVASSVVQPLFGHFSDRKSFAALMPLGLALGALGIALVGLAPSYPSILLAVVISGLGVAAFHPEATRFAGLVSGERRATGMSVFSVGGNAGLRYPREAEVRLSLLPLRLPERRVALPHVKHKARKRPAVKARLDRKAKAAERGAPHGLRAAYHEDEVVTEVQLCGLLQLVQQVLHGRGRQVQV
jgi:hypothetical protein